MYKKIANRIYEDVNHETEIIGWRTKRALQKRISLIIFDILRDTNNKNLIIPNYYTLKISVF